MASLVRQTSRCHFLLKTYNIVNSTEQLGRRSIKTWTYCLEQWGFPLLSPQRRSRKPVVKNPRSFLFDNHIEFCSSSVEPDHIPENKTLSSVSKLETETEPCSDIEEGLEEESCLSALEKISEEEAIDILAKPPLPLASFTLKDYVDHSETLRQLVHLGVDLSKVEKRRGAGQLLLQLDFEKDIQKTLLFLKDVGLKDDQLGTFLTKNPYILKEDLEDLQTRITYLTSKKFSKEAITEMVSRAPYLLLFSVERLDNRLGFFQNEIGLNTRKTRELVTRLPRLLTGGLEHIKENLRAFELELGFNRNEIRHIVHTVPRSLDANKRKLTAIFDYLHNTMGIPHKLIVHFPEVFNSRLIRIKERHLFLEFLRRAQYDPQQPNYVSLEKLVTLPDDAFCIEVAKAKIQDFRKFLKTLRKDMLLPSWQSLKCLYGGTPSSRHRGEPKLADTALMNRTT
nr:transcription termination factor 3, mitochondrial isoform X1 [Pogona vitticeps]XP_020640985.1 transcription termination factor 3, mitochondrial isoform X1 [Pogona vitticeps]